MRQILHVDLDAFFVSVEEARDPSLRGRPVIVGGDPSRRGVVASASYEARAYGVCAGMPLATARRLCPQCTFLKGDFARYEEASRRFMAILAQLTPHLEPSGIDEAYLDLTGFEPLYGPVQDTACRLKERIREELALAASVGIATNKLVAKVASNLCKPDGLLQVIPGGEASFLAPLPVGWLPLVGRKAEAALRGMGVKTIGQLAVLPLSRLENVFGVLGQLFHRWARGIDDRKLEVRGAAKSISRSTTFPRDTLNQEFLRAILHYLSERVSSALRAEGKAARCITLKLRYSNFDTITRSRTLTRAQSSDEAIFQTGLALMQRALAERPQLVRLIGIGVSHLVESGIQLHLLDPSPERRERLAHTLDSLRQRYGFTAVQSGDTLLLEGTFRKGRDGYVLETPALSR